MEEWRTEAIAEASDLQELLLDDDFSLTELSDRLKVWLEYLRLDPTQQPYEETTDE